MSHYSKLTWKLLFGILVVVSVLFACGESTPSSTASDGGSRETPTITSPTQQIYAVKQTAHVDGLFVTVNKVESKHGGNFVTPTAGSRYVLVDVTVENRGTSDTAVSSVISFAFSDESGQTYTENFVPLEGNPPDTTSPLHPGNKISGWLTYEVPTQHTQFTLIFTNAETQHDASWKFSVK